MTIDRPLVLTLDQETAPDLASLGGKGASLARLIRAGVPVPSTAVVTAAAYQRAVEAAEIDPRTSTSDGLGSDDVVLERFATAELPPQLVASVVETARRIGGGGPVAVRSSATVEDLGAASFAGQYRSLLGVDSTDSAAVMDAVRQVWASLWFEAPVAYRAAFGIDDGDISMAVVLMAMVPAECAGVIFTHDPAGGSGARVEMVEGLGESLVAGERTPSAWVVEDRASSAVPEVAACALQLARSIEQLEGAPQDVEWAAAGGQVWIVQARPITTVGGGDGFDTPVDDHLLTTAGVGEMAPGVMPPLLWDVNRFLLEEAYRSMFAGLGILAAHPNGAFVRRVRGRVAIDFDRLREVVAGVPGAVATLEDEYFRTELSEPAAALQKASTVASIRGQFAALPRQFRAARSRQHAIDQADVVVHAVQLLWPRRPALSTLADDEVLQYGARLVDLASRGLSAEVAVAAAAANAYARLERQLARYLGPGMASLRSQQAVAGIGLTRTADAGASAAVFAGPTWGELSRSDRADAGEPLVPTAPTAPGRAIDHDLRALPGWTRTRILTGQVVDIRLAYVRQLVDDVRQQLRRREQTKAAVMRIGGEVRRVHLQLGQRLHQRGFLGRPDDVHLLTTRELSLACRSGVVPGRPVLQRRRRWCEIYEDEGVLPLRFVGEPDRHSAVAPQEGQLIGWAASPGRAQGRCRVIRHPNERFEAGSILVAEATDATWSPLFLRAAAVVVERGGPLSHAAILARELGLPAVLNVDGACGALANAVVEVDGSRGTVKLGVGEPT